jgi:hypothetical protein
VNRAERTETVDEIIALANDIYAYSKQVAEERKQNAKFQEQEDDEDENDEDENEGIPPPPLAKPPPPPPANEENNENEIVNLPPVQVPNLNKEKTYKGNWTHEGTLYQRDGLDIFKNGDYIGEYDPSTNTIDTETIFTG